MSEQRSDNNEETEWHRFVRNELQTSIGHYERSINPYPAPLGIRDVVVWLGTPAVEQALKDYFEQQVVSPESDQV
jgi:hypothetical protein